MKHNKNYVTVVYCQNQYFSNISKQKACIPHFAVYTLFFMPYLRKIK